MPFPTPDADEVYDALPNPDPDRLYVWAVTLNNLVEKIEDNRLAVAQPGVSRWILHGGMPRDCRVSRTGVARVLEALQADGKVVAVDVGRNVKMLPEPDSKRYYLSSVPGTATVYARTEAHEWVLDEEVTRINAARRHKAEGQADGRLRAAHRAEWDGYVADALTLAVR